MIRKKSTAESAWAHLTPHALSGSGPTMGPHAKKGSVDTLGWALQAWIFDCNMWRLGCCVNCRGD